MQRVLVTGASGFIGSWLVEALVQREGCQVWGLARSDRAARRIERTGGQPRRGDLQDIESVRLALRDVDTVIHLGALVERGAPLGWHRLHAVNVLGTYYLLEEATRARVSRVVLCSTAAVLGGTPASGAHEQTPLSPISAYARSKALAERVGQEFAQRGAVEVVTVRPSLVYGPGDVESGVFQLFRAVRRRRFAYVGKGDRLIDLVHAQDVARGLVQAATTPGANGRVYLLASPQAHTVREVVQTMAEAYQVRPPWLRVPAALAWLGGLAGDMLARVGVYTPVRRRSVHYMTHHHAYSIDLAKRELVYEPQVEMAQGVAETAKWYMDKGYL